MQLALALGGLALVTGFVNGLLGGGGAVILVPLALFLIPRLAGTALEPHQISGLVLFQSVASAAGGWAGFGRRGHVDTGLLKRFGPVLAAGGLAGALWSAVLPGRDLVIVFAVVTSAAAILMVTRPPEAHAGPLSPARVLGAGVLLAGVAVIGGMIGIGAGFLIVPALVYLLRTEHRLASGSALALSLFLSGPALAGKIVTGQVIWLPAAFMTVAALAGSLTGAAISARVPVTPLRFGLAGVIALLSLRVWAGLLGF